MEIEILESNLYVYLLRNSKTIKSNPEIKRIDVN